MDNSQKTTLFEETSIAGAVLKLGIPTVIGSLVMVIYNLADTYFVGMLNDPVQNAAVTLAAPAEYLKWTVTFGAAPAILNVVLA